MVEIKTDKPIIVSMCLAGVNCNYKGESSPCQQVIDLVNSGKAIPLCPEQLGGLSTPRPAAERIGKKVVTVDGRNVAKEFQLGAERALYIARLLEVKLAILKARSPSCGKDLIYDGSHSGKLVEGNGLTVDLLIQNGIKVLTEEEL